MYKKTLLVNQNGDEFIGWSDNEFNPTTGELIFNTAMTGFVEILSDPSYINQIITFTSSHVGNYGMSQDDYESNEPKKEYEIPFSGGFDVRSITKHLRDCGSSMFAIGQEIDKDSLINLVMNARDIIGDNSALTAGSLNLGDDTVGKVGILDLGAKQSIVNVLKKLNFQTVAISPKESAENILSMNLKGILISNGPGDPRSLEGVIDTVQKLIGNIPIFGICLGHQILSLACGLIK